MVFCRGTPSSSDFYRQIAQADQAYTDEIENRLGELDLPVLVGVGTRPAALASTLSRWLDDAVAGW